MPTISIISEYDNKGRFTVKEYDAEGYANIKEYNEYDGSISTITDINGFETKYIYDGFGQIKKIEYPDGTYSASVNRWVNDDLDAPKETNHCALYSVYSEKSGTPAVVTYYDCLGRPVRIVTKGFNDQIVYKDTYYNNLGLVKKVSNPRYKSETAKYVTYVYDALDRPTKETLPDGFYTTTKYEGLSKTLSDALRKNTTRVYDPLGNIVQSTDANGNSVVYEYNSQGKCTHVTDPNGNVIEISFDHVGNRIQLIDPDLGTSSYKYNNYGQLTEQTDGNGNVTTFEYDVKGRVVLKTEKEGTTEYTYSTNKPTLGLLLKEVCSNNISYNYSYDSLGRLVNKTEVLDSETFDTSFSYDSFGRIKKTIYPSGFYVINTYNKQGMLDCVKDEKGKVYWTLNDVDSHGNIKQFTLGNGLTTIKSFNADRGWMEQITTQKSNSNILDYGYNYNGVGNLTARFDYANQTKELEESFRYDDLHRLTSSTIGSSITSMEYDAIGNITYKSDVGNYSYGALDRMPHAVSTITEPSGAINTDSLDITYTSFNKVKQIEEGINTLLITYGPQHSRKIVKQYDGGTSPLERYYVGSLFEREIHDGITSDIHYIMAGSGCVAVYTKASDDNAELKYLHKDHIGSVCATTDKDGNIIEKFSYDAWGKRRDPNTWLDIDNTNAVTEKRGFTGHEHLDLFALVNMNGRIYDPVVARFLSPDPFVQMPDHTQGLNRYTYCLNNPLNLTDPSGYSWMSNAFNIAFTTVFAAAVTVSTAGAGASYGVTMLAGALGGFAGGFTGTLLNGGNIGQAFKSGVIDGLIGGASAGLAKGIGRKFGDIGKFGHELRRAAAHGTVSGLSSMVQGGKFRHGFMSGTFSSIAGSGMQWSGIRSSGVMVVSSAVIGGTASEIGGGKFANGAISGAFIMWFNHLEDHGGEQDSNSGNIYPENQIPSNIGFNDLVEIQLDYDYVIVEQGDTIYGIANGKFKGETSVERIIDINSFIEYGPDSKGNIVPLIYPGQKLIIPRSTTTTWKDYQVRQMENGMPIRPIPNSLHPINTFYLVQGFLERLIRPSIGPIYIYSNPYEYKIQHIY